MNRISYEAAEDLIDFSGGKKQYALLKKNQLEAAVALYNMLAEHGFAYLADEVGMGKTYIALGTVALMRFMNPALSVLYIAPRANLQYKWQKEYQNFVRYNYRIVDQRVKNPAGEPAAPFVSCENLEAFVSGLSEGYYADFFTRMSSYSFGLGDPSTWSKKEKKLLSLVPGCNVGPYKGSAGDKQAFKDWYAVNLNRVVPSFDLVVIDEAHNLKHGPGVSARNQMLTTILGFRGVDGYEIRPRAKCALLLSATPYDQDFRQLYNQMCIVGRESVFSDYDRDTEAVKQLVKRFMVRRLANLEVEKKRYTRNMYRREWRRGGISAPTAEMEVQSDLQQLIVALFQKKVAELINNERFNNSFQMGMLASFESFLQTARVDRMFDGDNDAVSDQIAKEGIDTGTINDIAQSFKETFDTYLPHPKMDAVVAGFSDAFETGEKHLIYARRVMTVPELRNKFSEYYDRWIEARFRQELAAFTADLDAIFAEYRQTHHQYRVLGDAPAGPDEASGEAGSADPHETQDESFCDVAEIPSGENFFSWFFVKDSDAYYTPSRIKTALTSSNQTYATFFDENWLALLVGDENVMAQLARLTELDRPTLHRHLQLLATRNYVEKSGQLPKRGDFAHRGAFHAVQSAGLMLLARRCKDERYKKPAGLILRTVFELAPVDVPQDDFEYVLKDCQKYVELKTFFTELRQNDILYQTIYNGRLEEDYYGDEDTLKEALIHRELIASVIRLGQGMIDLYFAFVQARGSMQLRLEGQQRDRSDAVINGFIERLEFQLLEDFAPKNSTYRELNRISRNLDLLINTNFANVRSLKPLKYPRYFANILGRQSPVVGMWGSVNKTQVQQFRMPGYPFILIATDVLQEGEDLHTFCSSVIHYGISWTPISIEQKTGRVDRIGSMLARRFERLRRTPAGDDFIQVYFPYLKDTVEVYQVRKVCYRLNAFLEGLHDIRGYDKAKFSDPTICLDADVRDENPVPPQITNELESPFKIAEQDLAGQPDIGIGDIVEGLEKDYAHFFTLLDDTLDSLRWPVIEKDERRYKYRFRIDDGPDKAEYIVELRPAHASKELLLSCRSAYDFPLNRNGDFSRYYRRFVALGRSRFLAYYDGSYKNARIYLQSELMFNKDETDPEEVEDLVLRVCQDAESIRQSRGQSRQHHCDVRSGSKAGTPSLDLRERAQNGDFLSSICAYKTTDAAFSKIEPNRLEIVFSFSGRSQTVYVDLKGPYIRFRSKAANPKTEAFQNKSLWDKLPYTWGRNTQSDVVDFFFEKDGSLWGRVWQLGGPMGSVEFAYYAYTLAREADRLEYLLHGADSY